MSEAKINAGELLEARRRDRDGQEDPGAGEDGIPGERGAADLAGVRRTAPVGARVLVVVMGVLFAGFLLVLGVKAYRMRHREAAQPKVVSRVEKKVPSLRLAPLPAVPVPSSARTEEASGVPLSETNSALVLGAEKARGAERVEREKESAALPERAAKDEEGTRPASEKETVEERRLSRGFGSGLGEGNRAVMAPGQEGSTGSLAKALPGSTAPKGRLEEKLVTTELEGSSATVLHDRDYWLTQGEVLDCVLETKIVSTVPGMATCHLTRDAYSTSGRVVLLDRGSRLVGRFQGGMAQGDGRIFVVWTRAETPKGVLVTLDSPGTGPLGEAGVGGWVDQHFWDRFGAAMMVSLIGSGSDAVGARVAGPSRNTTVSLDPSASTTKEAVGKTYDSTVNMPPTLYVNQGERVGIFVARDLNFRGVYGLELARDARE